METKEWLEKFSEWLESEKKGSKSMVDEKWTVEVDAENSQLRASSIFSPFLLKIDIYKDLDGAHKTAYANIVVDTGLATSALTIDKKMNTYRKLLILNDRSQMVKYTLNGMDEVVNIRTDLDLANLNKSEFNDALMHTISAGVTLATTLGFEEEYEEGWMKAIVATFVTDIVEGKRTMEGVKDKLVKTLGFEDEAASQMVEIIEGLLKEYETQHANASQAQPPDKWDDKMYR
ncbi:MAG: hypothetical protein QCI38_04615 [Candidatus Thermoplasmatota archaeon]|nr:hypothetical protein [Candidatus Thermoplasmatota archaeon]